MCQIEHQVKFYFQIDILLHGNANVQMYSIYVKLQN